MWIRLRNAVVGFLIFTIVTLLGGQLGVMIAQPPDRWNGDTLSAVIGAILDVPLGAAGYLLYRRLKL